MGATKRLIEQQEELASIARSIIVRVGIWAKCKGCGDLILTYSAEPDSAYRYASTLWKNRAEMIAPFASRTDLMDTIKDVLENEGVCDSRSCSCGRIGRDNM